MFRKSWVSAVIISKALWDEAEYLTFKHIDRLSEDEATRLRQLIDRIIVYSNRVLEADKLALATDFDHDSRKAFKKLFAEGKVCVPKLRRELYEIFDID